MAYSTFISFEPFTRKNGHTRRLETHLECFYDLPTKIDRDDTRNRNFALKAACRAGVPDQVLTLLSDLQNVRLFPTLGGMHYLMINFSLKQNHEAVFKSFELCKLRSLMPNQRTYHIIIRECVDTNRVDEALQFAKQAEKEHVLPNRVTFNILMNGCRRARKAKELLQLRLKMDENKIEINDTTVKFTSLAYMMLGDTDAAVKAFSQYQQANVDLNSFCNKFLELVAEEKENVEQKEMIVNLLKAVDKNSQRLPGVLFTNLAEIK